MSKTATLLMTSLGLLALNSLAGMAEAATTFTLGSYSINANSADPGLVIQTANILSQPTTFTLNQGDSTTVDLFRIWTNESAVNPDDRDPKPISVTFNFLSPVSFSGTSTGTTVGQNFGFFNAGQRGRVTWNNPLILHYDSVGELDISLIPQTDTFNTGVFGLTPGRRFGDTVQARFTLVREVEPEPSSVLGLLALGTLGATLTLKRKLKTSSADKE